VHQHRRDPLVGEQFVGGDRREVVLVGEGRQPGVVVERAGALSPAGRVGGAAIT